jgi:hypothetical protein
MDWVTHAVSEFGHLVGIAGLALDDDGCALFALQPGGSLCLQDLAPAGGGEVLVTMAKPLPAPPSASVRKALLMADFRVNAAWDTQLALRGDELAVTMRIPRHSFMLSALEEAVEALFQFHSRVESAN